KIVNIVAAEMGVAIGGENLIDVAIAGGNELENGDVKGATTEIVDGDFAALLLVKTVGERGSSGLVDKSKNFEAGDFASVLGGLALGVVEMRGDGDDGAVDGFAEVRFCPMLEFAQDESGNFRRRENFAAEFDADDIFARWIDAERKQLQFILDVGGTSAHEPFDGIDGALGLREKPSSCRLAHNYGSVRIQANY